MNFKAFKEYLQVIPMRLAARSANKLSISLLNCVTEVVKARYLIDRTGKNSQWNTFFPNNCHAYCLLAPDRQYIQTLPAALKSCYAG